MNDPTKQDEQSDDAVPFTLVELTGLGWIILAVGAAVWFIVGLVSGNARQEEWTQHQFAAGAFEISAPASWRVERTDKNQLVLGDVPNNLVIIVIADVKAAALAQLPDTRGAAVLAASTITELRDFMAAYAKDIWTRSGWRIDNVTTTSRSADSIDIVVTGTNTEGVPVRGHHRFIEHGPYWIEVQSWSFLNSYEEHRDTLNQIVDSVRPTR